MILHEGDILDLGLYKTKKIELMNFGVINKLFNDAYSYDCYCPVCKTESVFLKNPVAKSLGAKNYNIALTDTLPNRQHGFKSVILTCSRATEHKIIFHFSLYKHDNDILEITKVGQFPSIADMVNPDTKKYRKVLETSDNHELNKAIGLYSHGVGVGSFVYLRRIFEKLIEKAHMQALQLPEWNDTEYLRARMHDKVGMLKDYLPEFLVENRMIYSILSKGVHELTEEECLEAFPAIKIGIELILDEEILKQEKERKKREAAQSIALIHQRLN